MHGSSGGHANVADLKAIVVNDKELFVMNTSQRRKQSNTGDCEIVFMDLHTL